MDRATVKATSESPALTGRDEFLKLYPWTPEEREAHEAAAERTVRRHLGEDCADVLQMLGLAPYVPAKKQRNTTPIRHGTRAGYTNRGCGREGSPPCPASPTCLERHNAYYVDYRQRRKGTAA